MKTIALFVLATGFAFAADPDFDTYWRDGKAELDGYRLTVSRYGQERAGQAVLIYVTEPFSESKRVKADQPGPDTIDVFKLNIVRDFQTGLYDYNTMVSVFVRSADLTPVKISFSSAEWCGHVYEELLFYPGKITGDYFSYFEGETGPQQLDRPAGGIVEDELLIALRGLRGAFGERKAVPFLPGVLFSRLAHKPLVWTTADISCAGNVYTVKIADGRTGKFTVEEAYPHRILRWELLPDVKAELTGTIRVPYWQLHRNGDEKYLKELGLKPTVE
ncbi:MAG: hypothetical protein WCS70_09125 [Verrucomicrobiota bacterium]